MGTSDNIIKDCALKSKNDGVCQVTCKLQNMSTDGADVVVSVCANCGKEGSDVNNICNKCKMVKYCNAACKKKHRQKHKKDCERRVAELHDIELFKQPPPKEDCPICFIRLPTLQIGYIYYTCCGKTVCSGCAHAPVYDDQGNEVDNEKCPYCRAPWPYTDEEEVQRLKKRVDLDDPIAIYNLGCYHRDGSGGFPQDYNEAFELWHQAGELGHSEAYVCLGYSYDTGRGVGVDKKKANHYYEIAAMMGDATARYNLGSMEGVVGNTERAVKHHMIAVRGGFTISLSNIRDLYSDGHTTKDDYTKALRLHQAYLGEIKSVQRDKAAAADERNRYY